ncbi:MAG: hypothetical protein U0Q10_05350 [Dermatophilaceae bacterium]
MDVAAKVTSKGQIGCPSRCETRWGVEAGDDIVFRVEEGRAVLARSLISWISK